KTRAGGQVVPLARPAGQAPTSVGRLSRSGVAFSKASAPRNRVSSWNGLATSWIATGSPPAPKPLQIEIAGEPATLNGIVKLGAAKRSHFGTASILAPSVGWSAVSPTSSPF